MSSEIVEDTVLVLDISRSMARADLEPNRFVACKKALGKFAIEKLSLNPQNQIGFVTFGEKANKEFFFTNDVAMVTSVIENAQIYGNVSYIGAAVALGIQMHVDMLRQISGKISRMLIISDGRFAKNTAMDPIKMAKLAQGLGIQIDSINVGIEDSWQILRQVTEFTGGTYLNISDYEILMNSVESLAKPLKEETREYLKSKKPLMSDLAGELVSVAEMTASQKNLIEKMNEKERERCIICYQSECAICKQPFWSGGRYCPNCASPMHLHCAAGWASSDKKTDSNVFRCPHCFYLLKVPAEVQKVQELRESIKMREEYFKKKEGSKETKLEDGKELVNKVTPQELGPNLLITAVCPVCDGIFEDEEYLFECGNLDCSALYHPDCFEKIKDVNDNYVCKKCNHLLQKFD